MKFRVLGGAIGGAVGLWIGDGTGLVGWFGGVPGHLVFLALGVALGVLAVPDIRRLISKVRR